MSPFEAPGTMLFALLAMKRNQWKSREEMEEIQEAKLRSLVDYAKASNPYYRDRFKDTKVSGLEDLPLLPLTTKSDVKGQEERFISREYRKESLRPFPTSGSTGIPLTVYFSPFDSSYTEALRYHLYTEAGLGPFDVQAQLTYARRSPGILQRLGLLRCHSIPFSNDNSATLLALRKIKPHALISCPSWMASLGHENIAGGFGISVRNIFCTGELLSEDMRSIINRSFGCLMRNRYGSIETGSIGWECEKGSLHVYSDSIVVEILDDHGNHVKEGKSGNVVLTPLWRRSMPFIRYEIGDRAALGSKCRCGRGLHVLKSLEGRNNDYLVLPSGRLFIGSYIGGKLRTFHGILQFQVVQERSGDLCIKVVFTDDRNAPSKEQISEAVRSILPEPLGIDVEVVDRIERNKAGKLCDFISKVKARK